MPDVDPPMVFGLNVNADLQFRTTQAGDVFDTILETQPKVCVYVCMYVYMYVYTVPHVCMYVCMHLVPLRQGMYLIRY